ncbi:MAG: HAMP domain-containing histidine kinase [Acidimicrobiia bacterium]|nr:HAMP domain-containing histidine kinase [Acidimicrobiia bacterium]
MAKVVPRSGRVPGKPVRGSKFTAIALVVGVGLALVFALVFSIAFGSKGVAQHAKALHAADEALRAATVARAQAGMAAHLVVLQQEIDFDAVASVEVARRDTRFALDDLAAAVADLDAHNAAAAVSIESAAAAFSAAVGEILRLAEAGDAAGLRAALGEPFDDDFRLLTDAVVVERDYQASQVAAADDTMGRVGDIARFLVAFVVPLSAVIVYRELTRRQHRQKELEVRLETEQELGKARDVFVANASHELRTPLTSIFGMAHLLEEDEAVRQSPAALEMLGLIISEAHDLNRMVDDLLTTARLDAGALHYQFENLPVVVEVVDEVVEPLRRAGITVEVGCGDAVVRTDRLRLRQVVRNLLSNAGKYGGSHIRLLGAEVDGWYELRVEDDGEGIPPELEARLFQRFLHQGDMPLVLGSVGLGLSIVRALAEGMGGAVWYERRRGWTCFVVRVPLAAAPEVPRYREAFPRAAAQASVASPAAGGAGADAHRAATALRAHVRRN